jgi:hypothetical protein
MAVLKTLTLGRVLQALDGDALDQAVGAYLANRHRITASADMPETRSRQIIAVDGKALTGSARLAAPRRHLLSAVTHGRVATIAQVEVGAKTNEVRHFKPLLAPLDLADTVVTFDALHSVKANITWLVETKKAHYIAVIKTNQPTTYAQLAALPWTSIKVQHTASPPPTAAASPARSKPALSPTTSAASLSPTPTSPSGSTAAASPPAGPKPARTSTRSPASPPIAHWAFWSGCPSSTWRSAASTPRTGRPSPRSRCTSA